MVTAARRLARREASPATFLHARFPEATRPVPRADVVAAASLLAVAPEREAMLRSLWQCVKPGGALLVVEPTERLTVPAAKAALRDGLQPPGRNLLLVWATARAGNAVDPRVRDCLPEVECRTAPLLGGLAEAWLFG
jgi:trans-aconitate methyltransferase